MTGGKERFSVHDDLFKILGLVVLAVALFVFASRAGNENGYNKAIKQMIEYVYDEYDIKIDYDDLYFIEHKQEYY